MKEMFFNKLKEVLNTLKKAEIVGVRDIESVSFDLNTNFTNEISILRNDQFELVFNKKTNEAQVKTTYSNQLITDEFMNQLQIIKGQQGAVNAILQTIIVLYQTVKTES